LRIPPPTLPLYPVASSFTKIPGAEDFLRPHLPSLLLPMPQKPFLE